MSAVGQNECQRRPILPHPRSVNKPAAPQKAYPSFRSSALLLALMLPFVASAMFSTKERGQWPATWPKELEPFRSHARTIEVATGVQENVFEIRFESREEFERAWPAILKLKTPGAPITLYTTNNPPFGSTAVARPGSQPFCSAGVGQSQPSNRAP
jgi:hypothetical protein